MQALAQFVRLVLGGAEVTSRGRVLVVEDEPEIGRLVQLVLQDGGFEVDVACDGHAARQLARAHKPRVILLDYMLPGGDGVQVALELRAICGDVPILLMSAADDLMLKAEQVGAVSRIDKPFELNDLEEAVNDALRDARFRSSRVRQAVSPPDIRHRTR